MKRAWFPGYQAASGARGGITKSEAPPWPFRARSGAAYPLWRDGARGGRAGHCGVPTKMTDVLFMIATAPEENAAAFSVSRPT
jgi:hypothetical protein